MKTEQEIKDEIINLKHKIDTFPISKDKFAQDILWSKIYELKWVLK